MLNHLTSFGKSNGLKPSVPVIEPLMIRLGFEGILCCICLNTP